jgi:hypothetical protein
MNQEKIVLANYYGLNSDEIYLLKTGVMNLNSQFVVESLNKNLLIDILNRRDVLCLKTFIFF